MKKQIAIVALTLFGGISAAQAQGFMPWGDVVGMADTDNDGALTMDEVNNYEGSGEHIGFQPFMTDHFQDLDIDGDGKVSMEELEKGTSDMSISDDQMTEGFYKGFGFMPTNQ